jgi:hypothetical protein
MFNSAIIEVIIGMIFVYSLLSILVTQVNTLITNILNTRAKHLKDGIRDMITDPVVQARFMSHPLIRLVPADVGAAPEATMSAQSAETVITRDPATINYIPPTLFSQALLDIIAAQAARNLYKPLYDAVERVLNGPDEARAREMLRRLQGSAITMDELRVYFDTISSPARQTLLMTLDRTQRAQAALADDDVNGKLIPLLEGVRHIQDPVFQKAMDTLLATARSVEEAAAKLEFWFNARMDQLSENYRRNIQYLSLFVGVILVLLLNADSLHLARTLWADPAVRTTIAAAAAVSVQNSQPPVTTPVPDDLSAITPPTPTTDELTDSARATIDQLLNLRLPLGWELTAVESGCFGETRDAASCDNPRNLWNLAPANNPDWFGLLLRKLAGYIVTVIAIAQGAPFWFDLLNRIARGRGN